MIGLAGEEPAPHQPADDRNARVFGDPENLAAALAGLGTRVAEPHPASANPASTMARLSAQGSLSGAVLHVAGTRVYIQSLGLRDGTSSTANSATFSGFWHEIRESRIRARNPAPFTKFVPEPFSAENRNYAEEQPASGILDSIHSRNTSFVRVPRSERPLEYGTVQWRSRTGTSDRLGWRIRTKGNKPGELGPTLYRLPGSTQRPLKAWPRLRIRP